MQAFINIISTTEFISTLSGVILGGIFTLVANRKSQKNSLKVEFWKLIKPELYNIRTELLEKINDINNNKYLEINEYKLDNRIFKEFNMNFETYGSIFLGFNFSSKKDNEQNLKNMIRFFRFLLKKENTMEFIKVIQDLESNMKNYNELINYIDINEKSNNDKCIECLLKIGEGFESINNILCKKLLKNYVI